MKKAKSDPTDWLRPDYKRSDFAELVRGKYASRIQKSTNVIVLDPQVAKVFPNDEAVNNALRGLMGATFQRQDNLKTQDNGKETRSLKQ
jgi:hypothetical protein